MKSYFDQMLENARSNAMGALRSVRQGLQELGEAEMKAAGLERRQASAVASSVTGQARSAPAAKSPPAPVSAKDFGLRGSVGVEPSRRPTPRQPTPTPATNPRAPAGPQPYIWPLDGYFTLNPPIGAPINQGDGRFGTPRGRKPNGQLKTHGGIDIAAPKGTPIRAIADGVVKRVDNRDAGGYGWQIVIEHPDGTQSQYAHTDKPPTFMKPDLEVKKGQVIGFTGISGNVGTERAPHLHFERRQGGAKIDPLLDYDKYYSTPRPRQNSQR